jgi:hypothetical protein
MDSSIEYSTYEPEVQATVQAQAPAPTLSRVVNSTGVAVTQELAFNPIPNQARVKRCSKCLIIMGWVLIFFGAINIVCNALSLVFMGGEQVFQYTDVDGQYITLKIDANTMMTLAILKIIGGILGVCQGRKTNKVFKPIMKEYKDAEQGVTQGIVMNKRRSKKMQNLKRKIYKITAISILVGFIAVITTKNLMNRIIE